MSLTANFELIHNDKSTSSVSRHPEESARGTVRVLARLGAPALARRWSKSSPTTASPAGAKRSRRASSRRRSRPPRSTHALKPLLIGADPLDTEVLWHRMYHVTRDYGRKGSVIAAISAIDIALWDIAGKARGVPIHALLGGAFRTRVQPYATGFYRITRPGRGVTSRRRSDPPPRRRLSDDEGQARLRRRRRHRVHDGDRSRDRWPRASRLMIDTNHAYGRAEALRLGRALADYNLRWYEEPVVPEDLRGYREMRDKLTMPIAGGENEHTLYGYRDLFAADAVDIAQPDLGSCGGITAARHIVALAQANGVAVNPHVWGSAIAQAASLQLIAALPVSHHSLFAQEPVLEYDRSSHPFRQQLITAPIVQQGGWVAIPEGPGLGIEVDRSVIERYRA